MKISKAGAWVAASMMAVASQVVAQQAVEWKVSDGGNGHWYQWIKVPSGITWTQARDLCLSRAGHLATSTSFAENTFLFNLTLPTSAWQNRFGPWLGGFQAPNFPEPAGGWQWVTGEPWSWTAWWALEPNNFYCRGTPEDRLHFFEYEPKWNDITDALGECDGIVQSVWSLLIEWEADCNDDGIVDYGQILSGELADTNGNGVPDCCEDGSTCTTSLTVNSGFESGSPLNACASESVSAGNLVASGWQVTAGTVDRIRGGSACATSTQPRFGDYCLDLCGTPASSGAIKQLVPTVPGHKYRCTFWLSGDASAGPAAKRVRAKVGTYVDLSYTFTCSGSGAQNWVANQFEFTARGANEPLEFVADNGVSSGGPMLDAISLVDITTQCVGDLDDSGEVDGADIALLLLNFGPCSSAP